MFIFTMKAKETLVLKNLNEMLNPKCKNSEFFSEYEHLLKAFDISLYIAACLIREMGGNIKFLKIEEGSFEFQFILSFD